MTGVFTIKQIPEDLKNFWANEAKRNARSMNNEIIHVLEAERRRRQDAVPAPKNISEIAEAVRRLQGHAVIDHRPVDEILYDQEGMPK